jgi:FkbM family methyltransferase
MIQKILQTIAKPFIGTGIGKKLPILHVLYKRPYQITQSGTFITVIPLGIRLRIQRGDNGPGLYLASTGSYEPIETQLFIKLIRKNDIVFDIGAHVGYYTTLAGKLVKGKGRVLAFEPEPRNYALLQENIAVNKLARCQTKQCAVGAKKGKTDFYLSSASSGEHSILAQPNAKKLTVALTTIDAEVKKQGIFPTIIKIDVEGAEGDVFKGMNKTLKNKKLRAVFLEARSTNIAQTLIAHNFSLRIIDERGKQIVPYTPARFNEEIDRHGYTNIVGIKNL